MMSNFDLWSFPDVARLSEVILDRLSDGSMPCDGAWSDDRSALFQNWIAAGKPNSPPMPEGRAVAIELLQIDVVLCLLAGFDDVALREEDPLELRAPLRLLA
jgi:hypothetical protein